MKITEHSIATLLAAIRDPHPTPGGGSAAALAGALGASLLAKVATMPKHRAASEEDVDRLQAAGARCADASLRLEHLTDEDSAAYDGVVSAYRLPKATDAEKIERRQSIQRALQAAADVPLEVIRRSAEAIEAGGTIARFSNPNASSDVGVALELLATAARGARLNVEINLASVDDGDYVDRVGKAAALLETECVTGAGAARALLTSGGQGGS